MTDPDTLARTERRRVRAFLTEALTAGRFTPECDSWMGGHSPAFSRALGEAGWIGMTWPRRYGGRELPQTVRQAVMEELLAAGAPVAAHWFADRQVGPSLLRHGTEEQRRRFLPAITRGELYFAIGMSEPDSGSDLASVRTSATRDGEGWRVTGTKVWTSHAHRAHYLLALVRTGAPEPDRHHGLSQLVVDLADPGVDVRPILSIDGDHHFNEVVLDGAYVPDENVVGVVGQGWPQVIAELAFERSGPERFLSTMPLLEALAAQVAPGADPATRAGLGRLYARLWSLRQLSVGVAAALDVGEPVGVAAALVKDLGTRLENDIVDEARRWRPPRPRGADPSTYDRMLALSQLRAPGFTLRGGASEVLRGLIARSLSTD